MSLVAEPPTATDAVVVLSPGMSSGGPPLTTISRECSVSPPWATLKRNSGVPTPSVWYSVRHCAATRHAPPDRNGAPPVTFVTKSSPTAPSSSYTRKVIAPLGLSSNSATIHTVSPFPYVVPFASSPPEEDDDQNASSSSAVGMVTSATDSL